MDKPKGFQTFPQKANHFKINVIFSLLSIYHKQSYRVSKHPDLFNTIIKRRCYYPSFNNLLSWIQIFYIYLYFVQYFLIDHLQ